MTKCMFIGKICNHFLRLGLMRGKCRCVKIVFASPLSLGEQHGYDVEENDAFSRGEKIDICKNFDEFLSQNKSDFIVVDLTGITSMLFEKDGVLYTAPTKKETKNTFYSFWKERCINPLDHEPCEYYAYFDRFIDSILNVYDSTNIVFIHAHVPDYYVVGDYVRKQNKKSLKKWLEKFEQRFLQRTKCIFIDDLKYYFSFKDKERIDIFEYEKYAYYHLAMRLKDILFAEKHSKENLDIIAYERCAKYYKTLNKKFLEVFLEDDNIADAFVKACPPDVIYKYIDYLRTGEDKDIGELYKTFTAILKGDFQNEYIDYLSIFRHGMKISILLKTLQEYFKNANKVYTKQIKFENYEYWFCYMQNETLPYMMADVYRERMKELETSMIIRPELVDVFGSCMSRIPLNFNESPIAANIYLFQVSPLGLYDEKMDYSEDIIEESVWKDTLKKIQLDHSVRSILNDSIAEWIIIDLYALSSVDLYIANNSIVCLNKRIASKIGASNIDIYNGSLEVQQYAKKELYLFANFLKQKYGEKIILVKNTRSEFFIRLNGTVDRFPSYQINREKNMYTNQCNEMIREYLGCWYVDIVEQFLSDELSLLELKPTHFENELYIEEGKIIEKIIQGKIAEKHIVEYSYETRVNRIIKLLDHNMDKKDILSRFFTKELDQILLKIPINVLRENKAFFVNLYNQGKTDYKVIEALLQNNIDLKEE